MEGVSGSGGAGGVTVPTPAAGAGGGAGEAGDCTGDESSFDTVRLDDTARVVVATPPRPGRRVPPVPSTRNELPVSVTPAV